MIATTLLTRWLSIFSLAVALAFAAGCALAPSATLEPTARSAPTQAEMERWERVVANADHARNLLESGQLQAGEPLEQFLRRCTPYRIEFVDRFAFIEFYSVPNLTGLSLVAADGKLASATEWGCVMTRDYFNTFTEPEKQAAAAAYHARLWPRQK